MGYLCRDDETKNAIKAYINDYARERGGSPSIREIAAGTGISRAMVQRYMAAMRQAGELDYTRRDVATDFVKKWEKDFVVIAKLGSISCGIPKEPSTQAGEYYSIPRSWVGEGEFYMVEADGDSMVDVGIDDGDLVIVRQTNEVLEGALVVALVEGTETTLKRLYCEREQRAFRLHAENATYCPEKRDRVVRDLQVQGVAVKVLKDLK